MEKQTGRNEDQVPKDIIHIIGLRNNWEIRRGSIIILGVFVAIIFFTLLGTNAYQYFYKKYLTSNFLAQNQQQRLQNESLQNTLNQLKDSHSEQLTTLQTELKTTKNLLEETQRQLQSKQQDTTESLDQSAQSIKEVESIKKELKEKERQLQKMKAQQQAVSKLQKTIREKDSLIKKLQTQKNELELQTEELRQEFTNFKKSLENPLLVENSPNLNSTPDSRLVVEQFQTNLENDTLLIQFNLKNVGQDAQSGHVIITPLSQNQIDKEVVFDPRQALPFFIKRFRPFSKEYTNLQKKEFEAIRITVWDRNRNKQLDQNYSIPESE